MKLTTKGTYGLKAAFELARAYGGNPIPLKDIAQSQELAEKYLEQLLALLKKAGIVQTVRGRLRRVYSFRSSRLYHGKPGAYRPGGRYDHCGMPEGKKV